MVRQEDETRAISALIADLGVRGVWQPQTEALFDVHVIDTDAQSYAHRPINTVLSVAERIIMHPFPFVLLVNGLMV